MMLPSKVEQKQLEAIEAKRQQLLAANKRAAELLLLSIRLQQPEITVTRTKKDTSE